MAATLVDQLNDTAIRYNREIKYAPVAYLKPELDLAGILLVPGIQHKHVNYMFLRRGGIMRPYISGMTVSEEELGKFVENEFQVFRAAGIDEDNIQNYRKTNVVGMNLGEAEMSLKNPADPQIFYAVGATWGEDLGDILFHGKRNASGKVKYDVMDGLEKNIADAVTSEKISVANKNMIELPPITFSTDETDTSAYDIVDEFLSKSKIKGEAILNVTKDTGRSILRGIFNTFKYTMTADEYGRYVIPGHRDVRLNLCPLMGYGDRMILTRPGVMQLGYDTQFNVPFVRVRSIKDDDQILTYNYGASYGTNILTYNCKMFMVSSGSLSPDPIAGDYHGKDQFTLNITGEHGTITKSPEKSKYALDDIVTVTATPSPSYHFSKWNDNNTENPRRIVVKGDVTLTATFEGD